MTSKDICEKCWSGRLCRTNRPFWSSLDEEWWSRGIVWCAAEGRLIRHTTEFPPPCCPYVTEHVVLREKR